MSYVGGRFRHDIFFSYAHGNDLLRDWSRGVAKLIRETLQILLSDREGALSFFTDEELPLNQPLTAELRERVQSCAALVIVMTGHYLKSPWCRDEGSWFNEIVAREPEQGRGMVFVLRAQPVPDAQWPAFLRDERGVPLPGYPFSDQDRLEALPWGLNHTRTEKQGQAVALLAEQLAAHLKARRTQEQARLALDAAEGAGPAPASRPRVLLGFATEDLEDERAALHERLAAGGLLEVVVPDWPADVDDIREAASTAAEGCEALVQLCGRAAGRWRHDAEGFVGFQIRLFEDTRRRTWLVPAQGFAPERLPASGYANLIRARAARFAPLPDPAAIRAAIEEDRAKLVAAQAGTAPEEEDAPLCAVFIQSRSEYEPVERRLRQELGKLRAVSAHVLPIPPLWGLANPRQISALIELRRRLAADLDAHLLLLTERPELLNEDLLDYLREQRSVAGAARLPAALVDASPTGAPPGIGGRLPVFRLGAPDFGPSLGTWLRECASRPRRQAATPSPAPPPAAEVPAAAEVGP